MHIEQRPIGSIKPYEKNPRKNEKAVDAVAASIREFGWQQPIVVDEKGVIIAGHTRYKAAKKMGLLEVPVVVAEQRCHHRVDWNACCPKIINEKYQKGGRECGRHGL